MVLLDLEPPLTREDLGNQWYLKFQGYQADQVDPWALEIPKDHLALCLPYYLVVRLVQMVPVIQQIQDLLSVLYYPMFQVDLQVLVVLADLDFQDYLVYQNHL